MFQKRFSILNVFIDGASSGNPGPSAIGILITDNQGRVVKKIARQIGYATNNQAEYTALLHAVRELQTLQERMHPQTIIIHTDSELLYNQLLGKYRVCHPELRKLLNQVQRWIDGLPVVFRKIRREENRAADRLAKKALKGG